MERQVLQQLESARGRALDVLDLGAGNGWLSYRLASRGHRLAAVDLLVNPLDGLGAYVHYDVSFTPVQAEFDRLPLAKDRADLVIFNGSLHYAVNYETTLGEALRVLRDDGLLVIMDSPVYHDPTSGKQMIQEREVAYAKAYGFPSDAMPSEGFLSYARLEELAHGLGIRWQFVEPYYGWRWALRPWWARLRGHREPAKFLVAVGRVSC
jgi:ubiquinone/menaquinone biosynthesis C-methylase UbiE